jgi:hypothetical protein
LGGEVAAGERLKGNARRHLNHRSEVSGMKKVLLVVLIAVVSLAVAAPSYASRGREAPPTAHVAKKKCKKKAGKKKKCKKKKKVTPAPAPTPKPLTDAEVIPLIIQRAAVYCAGDPFCVNWGYYYEGSVDVASCTTRSTYQWACFGWNDEEEGDGGDPELTCRFREIVDRVGIDGITSHQDLSLNPPDGWICGPWEG